MFPSIMIGSLEIELYTFFNGLGLLIFVLTVLLQWRRKKSMLGALSLYLLERGSQRFPMLKRAGRYALAELAVVTLFTVLVGAGFNLFLARVITQSAANFFGYVYIIPPAVLLFCAVLQIPPARQLDFFAVPLALELVFFKLGCYCAGCCYGKEIESHIFYNYSYGRYEIPVQLIECAVALLIAWTLFRYQKKNPAPGTVFAGFILLYSGTRFFSEFLRDDFPPILWLLNIYHIQCLIGVVYGLIWFAVFLRYGQRSAFLTKGISWPFLRRRCEFLSIFAVQIPPTISEEAYCRLLAAVPAERQQIIRKYRQREDALSSLISWRLLEYALGTLGIKSFSIEYGENGKPYLAQRDDVFFNISHSGGICICAIASREVGADVQTITPYECKVAEYVCTPDELHRLAQSADRDREFTKMWTIKESFVKQTGVGMTQDLKTVETSSLESLCYVRELDSGYICAYCQGMDPRTAKYREVQFDTLHEST